MAKGYGAPKRLPERAPGPRRPSGGLTGKERKSAETLPGGRFPMPDVNHARNAKARLNQAKGLTPAEKAKVESRANGIIKRAGGNPTMPRGGKGK